MAQVRLPGALAVLLMLGVTSAALAKQPTKRPPEEKRGQVLYERHCIQCHGDGVGGDGPATDALVAEVPNLRGALDKKIEPYVNVVLRGQGAMPGYSASLDDDQVRTVLRHMVKRSNKKVAPPSEEPDTERTGAEEDSEAEAGE